jgi:hypothetical protein
MRLWTIGLGAAAALGVASQAVAEPYLAVREGYKCSACHVNMTGGGMRTSFVSAHAREILHYPDWFAQLTKPADAFTGEINQYVGLGSDVRTSLTFITQDDPDKNGEVNNNQAFRSHLQTTDISVYEAVGYLNVNLIPDLLNVYLDERFAPSVDTREVFGMLSLPWDIYLKGGKMFLPYGLELQDDNAFIRGGRNGSATTGFSFFVSQPAFELGWEPGPMAFAAAVSQGVVNDRDVQLTGTDYFMFTDVPIVRSVLAGVSGTYNGGSTQTSLVGFFTGFNLAAFTGLGEVDFGHTSFPVTTSGQTTGRVNTGTFETYVEGNYLAFDWLNVKAAFDYADWDGTLPRVGSDGENRVSFGLEPFLCRFIQVRTFYRVSNGIASNPSHNQGLWSAEVHVFF